MQQKIDERMRQQALRTEEDFDDPAEYKQHVQFFAKDFITAIMIDSDSFKVVQIANEVEKILHNYPISDVTFALAGLVEGVVNAFKEQSNPTIILSGFMTLVRKIHDQRVAHETSGDDNA